MKPVITRHVPNLRAVSSYCFYSSLVVPIVRLESQPHPIATTAKARTSVVLLANEPDRIAGIRLSDSATGRAPE